MKSTASAMLVATASVLLFVASGCDADNASDDDDATAADDDSASNDDDLDDDNDNNDDDDTGPYTCQQVVSGLEDACQVSLMDDPEGNVTMLEWCELSEELFAGKLQSPFWTCMGDCVFAAQCDDACFDACLNPADPGGAGCGHAVHGIYECGVVFLYEGNPSGCWIPELDMAAACSGVMADEPWPCYGDCVATLPCSEPPTQDEAQALTDCMNACS